MLVTRESAMMTQTIYVRRCDPGRAGRPVSLRVAGRSAADFTRGRGSRGAGRRPPTTLPTLCGGGSEGRRRKGPAAE